MYYILYRTTNIINGRFYIGIHKTSNLEDSYLGSGTLLLRAIKKYGSHNFKKEILEYHNNEESLCKREEELITYDFIKNNDVYNIMPGGKYGGKDRNGLTFSGHRHSDSAKDKISKSALGRFHTEETKKKMVDNNFAKRNPEKQREHASLAGGKSIPKSEDHKEKIRQSILERNKRDKDNKVQHPNTGKTKPKITCPHCKREVAINTMNRWHFDNCKNCDMG